jgi:two-component system, LuxR family, sensor kinase FixL
MKSDTNQILDVAEVILLTLNASGEVVQINRKGCEILGYSESEIVGKSWFAHFIPERLRGCMTAVFERLVSGIELSEYYENPVLCADGAEREIAWHNSVLRQGDQVTGTLSSGLDINDRKVAEQVNQTILDTVIDGIITIDQGGRICAFNSAAEHIFGYSASEALGQPVSMLMPQPYRKEHDGYMQRYMETAEPRIIGIGRELVGVRKDGSEFPIHLGVGEAITGDRRIFTGIIRDLSEHKDRENELMAAREALMMQTLFAQRLQALAEMAGGISHELNQPLGSIRMYAETMAMMLRRQNYKSLSATLRKIMNQVDRAASVIRHMREFAATDRPPVAEAVALSDCVEGSLDLLGTQLAKHRIRTRIEIAPDMIVMADRHRLEQVICNLLANARDSIDEKADDDRRILLKAVREKSRICLRVSDTGGGIPEQIGDRLFEPFITSKGPDRGTGLGLSIIHGILKDYGAEIKLEKSGSSGTTFVLSFPVTALV